MTRTNQVLSLALIVQIVIGIFLFMPGDSDTGKAAGPLLAEFEPDKVMNLTIQDGDDNITQLHKTEQGEWVLPAKGNYPVLESNVQQLLNKLEAINRNRLIAQNQSSHNRLGVGGDEYERLIEIELVDAGTQTIYLGTSAGTSAAHVRLDDEDDVYLTSELAAWEVSTRLTSWVDTMYFSVPRDNIVMLQIENENGVFHLQKRDDTWTLVGLADDETLDLESITPLLSKVSTVRLTEPIGNEADPAWSMDEPVVKITVTVAEMVAGTVEDGDANTVLPSVDDLLSAPSTPDTAEAPLATPPSSKTDSGDEVEEPATVEKTYELRLGLQLEDNAYPLISSESEFYVKVSVSTADGFLNLTREDFLVVEPEADAETNPSDPGATPSDSDTD